MPPLFYPKDLTQPIKAVLDRSSDLHVVRIGFLRRNPLGSLAP